jgi:hypothetical protein
VEAETGMEETRAGIGGDPAEFLADAQGQGPLLFLHQMMEAKLENFGAVLEALVDAVKFSERLAGHAELCVAAGRLQLPFELHGVYLAGALPLGKRTPAARSSQ